MNTLKYVSPTDGYSLFLPSDSEEKIDETLVSYWCKDNDVLLQLSSFLRTEGEQISARDRLNARLNRESRLGATIEALETKACPDCAAAAFTAPEGIKWIYFYGVWMDLTIFATISGEAGSLRGAGRWAFDAIRSICRSK